MPDSVWRITGKPERKIMKKEENQINDLPGGWNSEPFVDTIEEFRIERTKQVQANAYLSSGKYPIIDQGQEIIAGWANDESAIINEGLPLIVFGDHTRIFKYIDFSFAIGADGTKLIKPQNRFDARYFYYYLLSLNIPSKGYSRHYKTLKEKDISYPSLSEQKKIAAVLYKIQKAIEAQETIIKTTQELKKSTMQYLFTHGLYGDKTKQTEIGEIPEGWEVRKLGDYATLITKGSSPRWQGFEYCNKGILFIRSQNIGWGKIFLDDRVFVPESFNRKEKRSILKTDDLLINLVGASIGRVAIADRNIEGANTNQAVALVRLDESKILSRFVMYYLLTYRGQNEITFNIKDIARANISLADINNINIPIVEIKEQNEIVSILLRIDQKIELAERKKNTLNNLFQSMLNKLMIGKIRVKYV